MKLYNSLSKKVEEFIPINPPNVGMYTCGPTVYDRMHIGNLRTFVLSDTLYRVLTYNGYKVKSIQNITDIDDKIIKRATEEGSTIKSIANRFTDHFIKDVNDLNILWQKGKQPTPTEYIDKAIIPFIKALLDKKVAYIKEGSVYFDISKFANYGELSGVDKRELKTGTRTLSDNYTKDDVQDFALWKSVPDDGTERFDSSWSKGRPGWHIECSAMSQAILGDQFDIHVGGVDLLFPHHENEIAQSEAKTGKSPFVKYWIHGAHVLVDGQKMSKSLNNFYTLDDVIKKGLDRMSLRYLYFQTHYRQEMNFTWKGLRAAENALSKLQEEVQNFDSPKIGCAEFEEKFSNAINDDLNMPQALAVVWNLIKSDYPSHAKAQSLFKFDEVLGLNLSKVKKETIPQDVLKLVNEREELRKQKRFHLSDQMRNKIKKLGYEVQDRDDGGTDIKKI